MSQNKMEEDIRNAAQLDYSAFQHPKNNQTRINRQKNDIQNFLSMSSQQEKIDEVKTSFKDARHQNKEENSQNMTEFLVRFENQKVQKSINMNNEKVQGQNGQQQSQQCMTQNENTRSQTFENKGQFLSQCLNLDYVKKILCKYGTNKLGDIIREKIQQLVSQYKEAYLLQPNFSVQYKQKLQKLSIQVQKSKLQEVQTKLCLQLSNIQELFTLFGTQEQNVLKSVEDTLLKLDKLVKLKTLLSISPAQIQLFQLQTLERSIKQDMNELGIQNFDQIREIAENKLKFNQTKINIHQKRSQTQKIQEIKQNTHKLKRLLKRQKRFMSISFQYNKNQQKKQNYPLTVPSPNSHNNTNFLHGSINGKQKVQTLQQTPTVKAKRVIRVTFQETMQKKEVPYCLENTPSQIFLTLEIQNPQEYQLMVFDQVKGKMVTLAKQKKFGEQVSLYINYEASIRKSLKVIYQGRTYTYPKNTELSKIKKFLSNFKKTYQFFTQSFMEYHLEQIEEKLTMLQVEKVKLVFGENVQRNVSIPVDIPSGEMMKYIYANSDIYEKVSELTISAIKINGNYIQLKALNPDQPIKNISKGEEIDCLILSFRITLTIQVQSKKNNYEISFKIQADQTIEQLKKRFEEFSKIQATIQMWLRNDEELFNNQSFMSRKIFNNYVRVTVKQIQNLEYYGFSTYQQIPVELFINFSIENDQDFKQALQKGIFPHKNFEQTFRVRSLGAIFSAIKKHCKIKMALQNIKKNVRQLELQDAQDDEAKFKLWQSNTRGNISFFNENYVLHNILLSASDELKIELMQIYKNHSPLFLTLRQQNQTRMDLLDSHFWINVNSFTVGSLELGGPVKGKSNLLNILFNLDFQISKNRHPLCSKSSSIYYNIYRNQDCLVDLIDISTHSLNLDEIKGLLAGLNMLIIHYHSQNIRMVQSWLEENWKDKAVILLERQSFESMENVTEFKKQLNKNDESQTLRKNYKIPPLDENTLKTYPFQFQKITDQINLFLQSCYKNSKNQLNLFSKFLAGKDVQKQQIIKILEQVQNNFSTLIKYDILYNEPTSENIQQFFDDILLQLVQKCKRKNLVKFMAKLRQSIKITRLRRMKIFIPINRLLKLTQVKDQDRLKNNQKQILSCIDEMTVINQDMTTMEFRDIVGQLKEYQKVDKTSVTQIEKLSKKLNSIFIQQISQREFSNQNLWRTLQKLFQPYIQLPQTLKTVRQNVKYLFSKDFIRGKTFQIINGDILQLPIHLLKSIDNQMENKKVMVVGIFGPQSSGKSTLLNYRSSENTNNIVII